MFNRLTVGITLKNHPFAVEAFFRRSLVLTYALPKKALQGLIPPCLELDTHQEQWAFIAVALVQTRQLRPKGLPAWLGNDFFLTGYRIFVKYHNSRGKRLRGLYILQSETDSRKMTFLGHIFTHYRYIFTDIQVNQTGQTLSVCSHNSKLDIAVDVSAPHAALPVNSPFADWKQARRFAGPLPFTFSCNPARQEVLIIEGIRENWTPAPVEVRKSRVGFMEQPLFTEAVLASAFVIENIPYYWKKGLVEKWEG